MIADVQSLSLPVEAKRSADLTLTTEAAQSDHGKVSARTLSVVTTSESAAIVVPLFAKQDLPEIATEEVADQDIDWPGALQLIEEVGAKLRQERSSAQDLIQQSQSMIRRTIMQAEEAEKRRQLAEVEAFEAVQRADRAEERARVAEERAQQSDELAQAARVGEEEARLWLRRLYSSLRREFHGLAATLE